MKHNKLFSGIFATLLAMLIGFSGIACVITAFSLPVTSFPAICLWCGLFSLLAALLFSFRWGSLVFTSLSLVLLNTLLRTTALLDSIESMIYTISRLYDSGYHWGFIQWSPEDPSLVPPDGGLLLLGCLVCAAVVWTVLRKRPLVFAMLAGFFPLLLCCVLQDTPPDPLPLWALTSGLCLLLLARSTSRQDDRRAMRLTAWLLIPVMLFNSFLFLWTPTVPFQEPAKTLLNHFYELIAPPSSGPGNTPGPTIDGTVIYTAEDLDLSQVGPQHLGKQRIMLVTTDYAGALYLRAQAYDTYTGTGWEIHADTAGEGGWPTRGASEDQITDISIFTMKLEEFQYFPYYVNARAWTMTLQNGALQNPDQLQRYTFSMLVAGDRAQYDALSSQEEAMYLALPDATQTQAKAILETIYAGEMPVSVTERAQMIRDYVKNSATYDLDTQRMPESEDDFALWFLNSSETGYCVHFATAATVLLRAAGIPARYVSGYMADPSFNRSTTITADQAHAWVEYLDPNRGWTVLEATPAAPEQEETLPSDPPETDPTEPSETQPTDPSPTTPPTEDTPVTTDPVGPVVPVKPMDWTWLIVALQVLLVFALLYGQYRLRKRLRHLWLTRGEPNRQAVRRWKYIRRFARMTGQLPAKDLYRLTEKAVFSQHTLTKAELSRYDDWIRKAHDRLLDKPWPVKILLQLLLAL